MLKELVFFNEDTEENKGVVIDIQGINFSLEEIVRKYMIATNRTSEHSRAILTGIVDLTANPQKPKIRYKHGYSGTYVTVTLRSFNPVIIE